MRLNAKMNINKVNIGGRNKLLVRLPKNKCNRKGKGRIKDEEQDKEKDKDLCFFVVWSR